MNDKESRKQTLMHTPKSLYNSKNPNTINSELKDFCNNLKFCSVNKLEGSKFKRKPSK